MLKAGDKAPDFKLISENGKEVTLKKLKGNKVVLYFYPKDDTSGCTQEACDFKGDHMLLEQGGTQALKRHGVHFCFGHSSQKL